MLERSEEETRDVILDSVADGVFTVDEDWRITTFNRAAEEITGVPREEAVGRPCCDVFRASICESACALKETLSTTRPIVNKTVYIINAEGQRIPISISTAILRNAEGEVVGGVETFRDLSMVEELRKELHDKYSFEDIIGRSAALRQIFDILPQVAESGSTVLIEGASGTGKELFARAIHNLSPRHARPFVAVNCAALPDTLLESELFGHMAGAFTDAQRDKAGRFTRADGGTIFLDEIGDVSPAMQTRLLRVLQEGTFEPLGSEKTVEVDVRVVTATNQDITQLVREGAFREDLYYRINVIRLELPPLRNRREDIPLLVDHFVARFNRLQNRSIEGVAPEAMAALMAHGFPGNIRELQNIIEHAFVLCRGAIVGLEHFPITLREAGQDAAPAGVATSLKELEAMHIAAALRRHGGNRRAAAKELGIHPSTFFRKVKALNIALPEADGRSNKLS